MWGDLCSYPIRLCCTEPFNTQGSYGNMAIPISQMTQLLFDLFLRDTAHFSVAGQYSVTAGYQQIMVCMRSPDFAQSILGTKSLTYINLAYRASELYNVLAFLRVNPWPWVCTFPTRTMPTGDTAFTAWQRWVWTCHWWVLCPRSKSNWAVTTDLDRANIFFHQI